MQQAQQPRRTTRRKYRPSIDALRVRDIMRLLRARHGDELPNDKTGRQAAVIVVQHLVALPGPPERRARSWIETWAPWFPTGDTARIIRDAIAKPRRWKADRLGWALKLNDQDRSTLKITTIAPFDVSKAERTKRRKARDKARKAAARRATGTKPRTEYEAASLTRTKPWETEGISRRTWERRRAQADASPSPAILL